jgi:uncharacterized protein (DUF1501 family)
MAKHSKIQLADPHACEEYNVLSRRDFLARSTAAALALSTPAWLPRVAYAQSDSSRDVIVAIFLRGGMDGLSVVVPHGDAAYYTSRPTIAVPHPDSASTNRAIDLDGFFGFPPALSSLVPAFLNGNLLAIQATGSIDPSRSHFDAQHFMEAGVPGNTLLDTGWLGRHLASRPPAKSGATLRALSMTFGATDMLAGGPATLPIPDPANFGLSGTSSTRTARLNWLGSAYASETDPLKTAAQATQTTIATLSALNIGSYVPAGGAVYPNTSFARAMRSSAALIRGDIGVEAIQIDVGGWDTHSAQGPLTGSMASTMTQLAQGLAAFHADMEGAGRLNRVTVVAMSEFGRNVRENGSQGTDHGHGNCMFVMGGSTNGRQVMRNWPGLAAGQLYQNQDLAVTIDHRDILAEIVTRRLGNTNLDYVFPGFAPTTREAVRV